MDFCTWFPEGWWSTCCEIHDKAYADQIGQLIADKALFLCVETSGTNLFEMVAGLAIATIMFIGVSVFGKYYYRKSK